MSILSALLFFHAGLFRAGLFITVIIAIWGLVIYIRKLPPSGGFRSLVIVLPIAATYTSGRDPRREPLVYGIAGLFMAGLTIRAFTTGA